MRKVKVELKREIGMKMQRKGNGQVTTFATGMSRALVLKWGPRQARAYQYNQASFGADAHALSGDIAQVGTYIRNAMRRMSGT